MEPLFAPLLPQDERDPKFREYITRLSHPSIRVLALVEIGVALLLHAGWVATGESATGALVWQTISMACTGALTLAASRTGWSRRHPRLLAGVSAWLAPAALIWSSLALPGGPRTDDYVVAGAILVLIPAAAIVPFQPWQALLLGLSVAGMYILSTLLGNPLLPPHRGEYVVLILLAILAAGISAANYEHRRAEDRSTKEALRVAETLTSAQLRAQLAENAISIGKMAAALSHEMNSPLGTLRSSVDTLLALTDRQLEAPPGKREQLARTRIDLARTIVESAMRIDDVTRRLRRFVNLEEAELKSADINDLLSDVTLLHREELERANVQVEFDLAPSIPPLMCRPQLLTAVFSSLLANAIQAVDGEGRISIQTRGGTGEVAVTIQDNGRGMKPEQVETIFEPSFKVDGSRVSSGNWSLFNSRQIIYEHGGEISIETAEGQGTAIQVTLPFVETG